MSESDSLSFSPSFPLSFPSPPPPPSFSPPYGYPHPSDLSLSCIYFCILITIFRYLILSPFFTILCIRALRLSPLSLKEIQLSKDIKTQKLKIPNDIYNTLRDNYEQKEKEKSKHKNKKTTDEDGNVNLQSNFLLLLPSLHHYGPSYLSFCFELYRRDKLRSAKLMKFLEAGWRFTIYSLIWTFGFYVLSDKTFFRESIAEVWRSYPNQLPTRDITLYYSLSLGLYLHLMITQFFDVKRKDFWEMFIHHIVTIALIYFSYGSNFVRIGSLVLILHDGSDVFLELAKLFNYCKFQFLCDFTFICFAINFAICRLCLFPMRVIWTTGWEAYDMRGAPFSYFMFNGLLGSLLCLHVFWFSIIVKMLFSYIRTGQVNKDARSESESESEGEADREGEGEDEHSHESEKEKEKSPSPSSFSAKKSLPANHSVSSQSNGNQLKQRAKKQK